MAGEGNRVVTLTDVAGTLNQYAGKYMVVYSGDQAGTKSLIVSNTEADPTVLTVTDDQEATLAGDLIAIQTSGIVFMHIKEGSLTDIGDRGGLVFPPEIRGMDFISIEKIHLVKLIDTTEANLSDIINDIIVGTKKLRQSLSIDGYTKPDALINITLINSGNRAWFKADNTEATQDIIIIAKWVIS